MIRTKARPFSKEDWLDYMIVGILWSYNENCMASSPKILNFFVKITRKIRIFYVFCHFWPKLAISCARYSIYHVVQSFFFRKWACFFSHHVYLSISGAKGENRCEKSLIFHTNTLFLKMLVYSRPEGVRSWYLANNF